MKTNIVIDKSPPITYLAKFWFSIYRPKCCWPIDLQDFLKCNISRKKWMLKFILSCRGTSKFSTSWCYHLECAYPDMPKVPKIRSLHIFAISRVTQSTQNNKLAISSQYLKENGKNKVYFLLADKHQRFLQIDTII